MNKEQLNFIKKIERFCNSENLFEKGSRVLVCLSGGADSVCLLRVLFELRERFSLTLYAAHVNHMLRGADADADEQFCRKLCAQLGVELFVLHKDVARFARETGQGVEAAARQVRYDYFFTLQKQLGLDRIATAHNLNDNAETSLMYFLRGAGTDGIGGIRARRGDGVVRPLLCVSRSEIEAFLEQMKQTYVTDATNKSDAYTRNRIRNRLLPQLAADYNPNIVETIARNAALLALDAQYLNSRAAKYAETLLTADGTDCLACVEAYSRLDKAVALRVLRLATERAAGKECSMQYETVMRCDALFGVGVQGKSVCISGGLWARREYEVVRFYQAAGEQAEFCYLVTPGEKIYIAEIDMSVSVSLISDKKYARERAQKQKNCEYFDYNSLSGQIYIRSRKNGDAFVPFGMEGSKKLKDFLIDEKIPARLRGKIPLVVCGGTVLWVCGYRRSNLHRITGDTEIILKIEFWEGQ